MMYPIKKEPKIFTESVPYILVVNRDLPLEVQKKFARVLRKSVEFAIANRESSSEFVKCHAQEMETEVIDDHINLYVNEFSVSLGEEGRRSVEKVFEGIETKNNIFL